MPEVLEQDELQQPDAEAETTFETTDGKPYAEDFANLSEERVEQLKNLCHKFDVRDQWARQIEILRTTLLRFFWLGLQHTWFDQDAGMYQVGPQGGLVVYQESANEEPTFKEDFNIFTGYGKSFIAVFIQNSAPVRMEPDKAKDPRSIEAAEEAQKYVRIYEKHNPPKLQQTDIGRLLWTDGRVLAVTESVADPRRKDENGEPVIKEITRFAGVLESKVPIYESNFHAWPYAKISKDHDICYLRDKHKRFAKKIAIGSKTSSPNEEIARMSRIATAENVTQLSQDTLKYLVTEDEWWLRPCAFTELEEDDQKFWDELLPEGCKVVFSGGTYCGARAVSMDDNLEVMHALPGEGQSKPSLGDPEVPVQMEYNDALNLAAECLKYAIPSIWADMDEVTIRAIMEQKAAYGAIRPYKGTRAPSEPMENLFFAEPTTQPPAMFPEWIQNLQGPLSQFITGQQPALFGAQMEDQKTAHGYAQARDQALGLMALVWIPFKTFYSRICEQAAMLAAKRQVETMAAVVPKGNKTETIEVDVAKMRSGFQSSPVSDENFPESWTQKSNKLMQVVEGSAQNPILMEALMQPDNLVLLRDKGIGIDEFVIPGADDRDVQLAEWAQMLENDTGPVQDEVATEQKAQQASQIEQQTGIPLPAEIPPVMRSSVPIDPDTDNHKIHAEESLRILNSPDGQKIKKMKPEVWQDLKLHYLAHKQAMAAATLQAAPPVPLPAPAPAAAAAGAA